MKKLLLFLALLLAPQVSSPASSSTTPSFSAVDGSALESAGSTSLIVKKSIVAKSYSKVTITTLDGTAKANVDYSPVSTSVTVGNKQLTVTVPVTIYARPGYQGDRGFSFRVTVQRNGTVARSTATMTIKETEVPAPAATWTQCAANENDICYVVGTAKVRYGANGFYITKQVTGSISCDYVTFGGDPIFGVYKHCDTDGRVGTAPPPPPPPVVCPDGTTLPAGSTCPVVTPPPPPPPPTPSAGCPTITDPRWTAGQAIGPYESICTATSTCLDAWGTGPNGNPNNYWNSVLFGHRYWITPMTNGLTPPFWTGGKLVMAVPQDYLNPYGTMPGSLVPATCFS